MIKSWCSQVGFAFLLLSGSGIAVAQEVCSQADRSAIEQMLIVKVAEATGAPRAAFLQWLSERNIGGVYLSKKSTRNLHSAAEVSDYITALQRGRETGLFVSIDQEGGSFQGLDATNGFAALPAVTDICKSSSGEAIAEFARTAIGQPLAQVGVNMNFAPVIDVALNAQSDIIVRNGRACSDDPARVAAFGIQVADGLTRAGVIPVGKHFPGHGDVAGDTHSGAVYSNKTLARLEVEDLVPFKAFVDAQGPAIMVSHIVVTEVDDTAPASLSRPVVTGILRERYGYEGVVITDDLTMKAVTEYTNGQTATAARQAILAGVDLLIIGQSDTKDVVSEVCRGLNAHDGSDLRGRVIDANDAILGLKQRFGIRTVLSH